MGFFKDQNKPMPPEYCGYRQECFELERDSLNDITFIGAVSRKKNGYYAYGTVKTSDGKETTYIEEWSE